MLCALNSLKNPTFRPLLFLRLPVARLSSHPGSKIAIKHEAAVSHRFSPNLSAESFFVDRSRLTRAESAYQLFSTGFSLISVVLLVSFPLGLFLFLTNSKSASSAPSSKTKADGPCSQLKLPVITSSKSIFALLSSKVPVVIVYFRPFEDGSNSIPLRLTRLALEELSPLLSGRLRIVCVNLGLFQGGLAPSLVSEVTRSCGLLFHLLLPRGSEPLIAPLPPLTSLESFLSHIQSALAASGVNQGRSVTQNSLLRPDSPLVKPHSTQSIASNSATLDSTRLKSTTVDSTGMKSTVEDTNGLVDTSSLNDLDNKLSLARNCLFELELNGRSASTLASAESLDSFLHQCQSLGR